MSKEVKAPSRDVRLFSTQEGKSRFSKTSVATWGELKKELQEQGFDFKNKVVRVKETRNTLELDSALLPTTPFTLFYYPAKVKAGARKVAKKAAKKAVKKVARKKPVKKAAKKAVKKIAKKTTRKTATKKVTAKRVSSRKKTAISKVITSLSDDQLAKEAQDIL